VITKFKRAAAMLYELVGNAAAALDEGLVAWESQNMSLSVLRALGGILFTEKKASLLHELDKAVRTFISTNNFEGIIRDAKANHTPINQRIYVDEFRRTSRDANLFLRYPGGKATTMDRLREKFGPKYNYREGDELHLPPDKPLRFTKEKIEDMNVTVEN
jgi:hypothetical protein